MTLRTHHVPVRARTLVADAQPVGAGTTRAGRPRRRRRRAPSSDGGGRARARRRAQRRVYAPTSEHGGARPKLAAHHNVQAQRHAQRRQPRLQAHHHGDARRGALADRGPAQPAAAPRPRPPAHARRARRQRVGAAVEARRRALRHQQAFQGACCVNFNFCAD